MFFRCLLLLFCYFFRGKGLQPSFFFSGIIFGVGLASEFCRDLATVNRTVKERQEKKMIILTT
jgi:hypothetical protein